MRVLQVHNSYVASGGEEAVVRLERELLEAHGHVVETLEASNRDVRIDTIARRLSSGVDTVWSQSGYRLTAKAIRRHRPDIVHVHNTFQRLSPSVCWAADRAGVPLVMTLHNYRLVCVNGLLLREGRPCEACVGKAPWSAVRHRCYRGSLAPTAAVSAMQVAHRVAGTFRTRIDAFVVLSEFARDLFARGGLPEDRLHVKPNFTPDYGVGRPAGGPRPPRVVYVGRISPEKSVDLLLDAWSTIRRDGAELVVVGDGPDRDRLERTTTDGSGVTWLGWLDSRDVIDVLLDSRAIVLPSRFYEGFPVVVPEAFSVATPLIAPGHGPFPEIVGNGEWGLLFRPGDPADLARALEQMLALPEGAWLEASRASRRAYELRYSADRNYALLVEVYGAATARRMEARSGGRWSR